jgi:hypothetical protein
MTWLDRIILLLTGLTAIYLLFQLWRRYQSNKQLHDVYYLLGFGVLLVSGLLLISLGYSILGFGGSALSPYILPVASLIPLGISMGLMNQFLPTYKKYYSWFALVGILAIAISSIGGLGIKKLVVPIFHGAAGLIIFLLPFKAAADGKVPQGFQWVAIGGALISLGGIALAFLSAGSQLLFFSGTFVLKILALLLFLMTLAFTWGFVKDIRTG